MKKILVDCRIDKECLGSLRQFGYEVESIPENPHFDSAVCAHPDMNVLQIGTKVFATRNVRILRTGGKTFDADSAEILKYPNDVFLNAVCIGNDFICRKASVAPQALRCADELGMRIINVNQGYVKCNLCVVDNERKAVITEDKGIEMVLNSLGYDVLLLQSHEVKLHPYKNGFIGGASGMIDNKIVFTGDVSKHSEFEYIKKFCDKYGKEVMSLSNTPLYDYGSVLVIDA